MADQQPSTQAVHPTNGKWGDGSSAGGGGTLTGGSTDQDFVRRPGDRMTGPLSTTNLEVEDQAGSGNRLLVAKSLGIQFAPKQLKWLRPGAGETISTLELGDDTHLRLLEHASTTQRMMSAEPDGTHTPVPEVVWTEGVDASVPITYPVAAGGSEPFYRMTSNDTWVISGDPGGDSGNGVVAAFNRATKTYTYLSCPVASTNAPGFGVSVLIAGGKLFVGAYGWSAASFPATGRVFVYNATTLAYESMIGDFINVPSESRFGCGLASTDGNTVFIGANCQYGSGNGYVYVYIGGTYSYRFQASSPALFANSVFISPNGAWLVATNNGFSTGGAEIVIFSLAGSVATYHSRIVNVNNIWFFGETTAWDTDSLGFWIAQNAGIARHYRYGGATFAATEQIGALSSDYPVYVAQDRFSSNVLVVRTPRVSILNSALVELSYYGPAATSYHRPIRNLSASELAIGVETAGLAITTQAVEALLNVEATVEADKLRVEDQAGTGVRLVAAGADGTQEDVPDLPWDAAAKTLGAPAIKFAAAGPTLPAVEGVVYWNPTEHCLEAQNDVAASSQSLGRETWARVVNKTGATLTDGTPVYVNGAQGNRPTAALATAASGSSSAARTIGIVTADIANNAEGHVAVFGPTAFNTSGFTEGDELWLSSTGTVTNVRPSAPEQWVFLGNALNSAVNGKIFVSPHYFGELHRQNAATKGPTGIEAGSSVAVSYSSVNRTVTLTQAGGVVYWWRGERKVLTSPWTSAAHTDAVGTYFLYSNDGVNFSWSTTPWLFSDIQVAYALRTALLGTVCLRETHGVALDHEAHEALHVAVGTRKVSGGALTAGTYAVAPASPADADNTPGVDSMILADEDNRVTLPAIAQGTYKLIRLNGSAMLATDYTLPFNNGTSYPFYNPSGTDVEMSTNRYANVWLIAVPAADDASSQAFRFLWLQPQRQHSTLAAAQAELAEELSLGDLQTLLPEFFISARITFGTSASYGSTGKCRIESVSYLSVSRAGTSGAATLVAHAATHAAAGSDPITVEQSQVTNLTADLAAKASVTDLYSRQFYNPALDALSSLSLTPGLLVQTTPKKFTKRTVAGTSGQVTVTNGDGNLGNPTISLPSTITLAVTWQVGGGITVRQASTQDGLQIVGRPHGTGNYVLTMLPRALSRSITQELPNRPGTQALTTDLPATAPSSPALLPPAAQPPSSFGSFPAAALAIPSNAHRVTAATYALGV